MSKKNGLDACIEAFERLKEGEPNNPKHIGLHRSKFTAGIVSFEAGLDRGYLKRARTNHAALISLIESHANEAPSATDEKTQIEKKLNNKIQEYKNNKDVAEQLLYQSLGRELLLVSKIKELEQKITKIEKPTLRIN